MQYKFQYQEIKFNLKSASAIDLFITLSMAAQVFYPGSTCEHQSPVFVSSGPLQKMFAV